VTSYDWEGNRWFDVALAIQWFSKEDETSQVVKEFRRRAESHGGLMFWGKVKNVAPASQEQCSRVQLSR